MCDHLQCNLWLKPQIQKLSSITAQSPSGPQRRGRRPSRSNGRGELVWLKSPLTLPSPPAGGGEGITLAPSFPPDECKIAVIASYCPITAPADGLDDFNQKERSRCRLAADTAGENFKLKF